jgi:hypothetical protein
MAEGFLITALLNVTVGLNFFHLYAVNVVF